MRYVVTVAALILSYGTTASYAQQAYVNGMGNNSCGKYLAAVHGHAPGKGSGFNDRWRGKILLMIILFYMQWLAGFLTATNLWVTNEPNSIRFDGRRYRRLDQEIVAKAKPDNSVIGQPPAFVWDQRRDYLEAWSARQAR